MKTYEEINKAAQNFLSMMEIRRNARFQDSEFEIVATLVKGRKYHRIVTDTRIKATGKMFDQRSCGGFIDGEGNIYKSAGWKAPAKNIRGNIFDDGGLSALDCLGYINYLR